MYLRGLGEDSSLDAVEEAIGHPKAQIVGLVIDKVDKIMHGMELGTAGMHNQVRQWVRQGFLAKLIELLHGDGFGLFLTADHGNVEARGCGRPAEGAIADLRGERVRVYTDAGLRRHVKEQFPEAIEWAPIGLPQDCLPLIAAGRSAFVLKKETTVAHGGVAIEELLVPFVQIDRATA